MLDENSENINQEIPANESKADRFLRLAPARINKVLSGLQSLGKLSSHNSYEYTEEQVQKMFGAIRNELEECEAAFKPKEKREDKGFSF